MVGTRMQAVGRVLAAFVPLLCGCAAESVFEGVIGVDAVPPSYVSAHATSTSRLTVEFSESVSLTSVRFDPALVVSATRDGAAEVQIDFGSSLETGRRYVMDLTAADSDGNTITVLAPFVGRNENPPSLVINEIRTEYSKPKAEYVELFVKEAGEIGGLSLATATAGFSEPLHTFPPLKVSAGDFIVVHLRTLEEGSVDEVGSTDASPGTDSSPSARDFWVPGVEKRIRKTDVVAVLGTDGKALDGVAFSEAPEEDWKSDELRAAVDFLRNTGAWVGKAASSAGSTTTRTLCRNAASVDRNSSDDWKITATGGATPGAVNKETIYAPKKK